jgi:hypothetical protein
MIPLHGQQIVAAVHRRAENNIRVRELGEGALDELRIEAGTVRSDYGNGTCPACKRLLDCAGHPNSEISVSLRAKRDVIAQPCSNGRSCVFGCVTHHDMRIADLTRHAQRVFGKTPIDPERII